MQKDAAESSTTPQEYLANGLGPELSGDPRKLYIDIVKRTVANIIYEDPPLFLYNAAQRNGFTLGSGFSLEKRMRGEDSPIQAHTMIGVHRLNNIQACVEDILERQIPGDLIETGAFRGGATIFMRAILKAYGVKDRRVWVCDTFVPQRKAPPKAVRSVLKLLLSVPNKSWQKKVVMWVRKQVPEESKSFPDSENPSDEAISMLVGILRNLDALTATRSNTGLDDVKSHFARYGLLDDQVQFLKGFFANTLPSAPIERLALLRLDADLYESTMDALNVLYPKLSPGGYCIVDDYHISECRRAIEEYRGRHHIDDPIIDIDGHACYWKRT